MRSMNQTAAILRQALCIAGRPVTIDRRTFYSRVYQRMLTKYTVKLRDPDTGKITERLETYKLSEVIRYLAERYLEEKDHDR